MIVMVCFSINQRTTHTWPTVLESKTHLLAVRPIFPAVPLTIPQHNSIFIPNLLASQLPLTPTLLFLNLSTIPYPTSTPLKFPPHYESQVNLDPVIHSLPDFFPLLLEYEASSISKGLRSLVHSGRFLQRALHKADERSLYIMNLTHPFRSTPLFKLK